MARQRTLWTALAIVYVVWGSTYLAMRYLVETVPPFIGASARFLLAGAILAVVVAATRGVGALKVRPREAASSALVGVLLLAGGNALVMLAERSIDSGLAALVVAAVPLFVVVLRVLGRDRPPAATLAGVLLGFGGLAVLVHPGGGSGTGVLVVLFAAFSWSVGSYLSGGRLPLPADPLAHTTYEMIAGGLAVLPVAAARGDFSGFALRQVSTASWLALAYLVVFGSLVAFTAYVWLLREAPISLVSTYAYVNPAVAVLLGTLTGEALTGRELVGGAVILAAVAVVVTTESRARRRTAVEGEAAEANGLVGSARR